MGNLEIHSMQTTEKWKWKVEQIYYIQEFNDFLVQEEAPYEAPHINTLSGE